MKTRIAIPVVTIVCFVVVLIFAIMPRERTYTGVYTVAFEHQGFRADGYDEEWWVSGELVDKINMSVSRTLPDGRRVFEGTGRVTLRGVVSWRGRYGHFGMWPRQIKVTEIVSVIPTN